MLDLLIETTFASSAAIALVLLLRLPVRHAFGVMQSYALWSLVPASMLAVLLPAASVPLVTFEPTGTPTAAILARASVAAPMVNIDLYALALWLIGATLFSIALYRRQRAFLQSIKPLSTRDDGMLQGAANEGLPAVIGWRAQIAVPADFEQRYNADERELMLCHERIHQQHGDVYLTAFASLLRCTFWFNPLLHIAAYRFCIDMELTCDAAIMRRHPTFRRRYGEALLKAQLATLPLPIGCRWFGSFPLKERITMLKQTPYSRRRRTFGGVIVASLIFAGSWAAWAGQPARLASAESGNAALASIQLTVKARINDGQLREESRAVVAGAANRYEYADAADRWVVDIAVSLLDDGRYDLRAEMTRNDQPAGSPRLIFNESGASIRIGSKVDEGDAIDLMVNAAMRSTVDASTVETQGKDVSARTAAAQIAKEGGLRLVNPELLDDTNAISFSFNAVPAEVALRLIANESGMDLRIDGTHVAFVPKSE